MTQHSDTFKIVLKMFLSVPDFISSSVEDIFQIILVKEKYPTQNFFTRFVFPHFSQNTPLFLYYKRIWPTKY